jgi:hypothetical protein
MDRGAKRNRPTPHRKDKPLWEEVPRAILKLAIIQWTAKRLVDVINSLIDSWFRHR